MNDNKTHSLIAFSDFAIYNDGNLFITMCNFSKVILISMTQQEGFWTFRIGFALYRHIIYFHADAGNLWPAVWLPYLFQRRYMLYLKCDKKVHQLRCILWCSIFFWRKILSHHHFRLHRAERHLYFYTFFYYAKFRMWTFRI